MFVNFRNLNLVHGGESCSSHLRILFEIQMVGILYETIFN